ncbi:hypothetical protein KC19_VG121600 [Ceratodon purpureus]|uniref:Uncharacterized protein n=1 Tax=Ceratodon purpureus TaxID=3225 RepID=A0A8T0HP79_CERPU|nr:hypothetical protein KC19_VG121600 [Ceratodon purpureus]
MRIQELRHDAGKTVSNLRHQLAEEGERLRYFERKVVERTDAHNRASAEYSRARDVHIQAKIDEGTTALQGEISTRKLFTKACLTLVESWFENVAIAFTRLDIWEFKLKRQKQRYAKLRGFRCSSGNMQGEAGDFGEFSNSPRSPLQSNHKSLEVIRADNR